MPIDDAKALAHIRREARFSKQDDAALAATGDAPASLKLLREQLGKIPEPSEKVTKLIALIGMDFKRHRVPNTRMVHKHYGHLLSYDVDIDRVRHPAAVNDATPSLNAK